MSRTEKSFYSKFVLALLLIEAYYTYCYYSEREYTKTTQILSAEFNITNIAEPFLWFSLNAERELFYNNTKPILQTSSFLVAKQSVISMYALNDDWENMHILD